MILDLGLRIDEKATWLNLCRVIRLERNSLYFSLKSFKKVIKRVLRRNFATMKIIKFIFALFYLLNNHL